MRACLMTVSYTHLDVYKRQELSSANGAGRMVPVILRMSPATVMTIPEINPAQTPARVVLFQNRPYKNGPRKAPASAPHEIDIRLEIMLLGLRAIRTETAMKPAHSSRITNICRLLFIFGKKIPFKKSMVKVELEVITNEERVDIEAESTRIMTTAINRSGRDWSCLLYTSRCV